MRYLVHHLLLDSANRDPLAEALVDDARRLDFQSTAAQVASLAHSLVALGIRRGDRVAVYLKPTVHLPVALLAISQAGGVFVPIHHGAHADQVRHIVNDCQTRALITDEPGWARVMETSLPTLDFATVVSLKAMAPAENTTPIAVYDWDDLCTRDAGAEPSPTCIGKDLAAILYTSGSTGRPKGVMLSHANILAGAEIVANYLNLTSRDRVLAALPLSFDAGLNQLTTCLLQGGTAVMLEFRFAREIVRRLVEERITGLAGVPSLWCLLAQSTSGLSKAEALELRYITNTGGAMPQSVLNELRRMLPRTDIFLMYGLTEAFRSTYLPPSQLDVRPTSMGRAIPNTEILVVDEQGKRCGPGEVGELVHHGPTVSLGYWAQPELTRAVLRPHPFAPAEQPHPDLVCYSGDLVVTDEEGYLYFVGRRDNQIKSAGFRISPTEVEDVLYRVAPIRQAAVVGVPDSVLGQHLVAFLVPSEPDGEASVRWPGDILAQCAEHLPRYMIPKRIEVVDQLPMTASGKVDYPLLRARCAPPASTSEVSR